MIILIMHGVYRYGLPVDVVFKLFLLTGRIQPSNVTVGTHQGAVDVSAPRMELKQFK